MHSKPCAVLVLCVAAGALDAGAQAGGRPSGPPPAFNLGHPADSADIRVRVKVADGEEGIRGRATGPDSSVFFQSRQVDGELRSTIVGPLGEVLYEYREFHERARRLGLADGSFVEVEQPPKLEILGVPYDALGPWRDRALNDLAARPEAELIRRVGLELVDKVPGAGLVAERRGLELATQALWPHLASDGAPPFRLTADYEITPAGYVVRSQPTDLVLAVNRTAPSRVVLRHNDYYVDDCFGRCGQGCTGGFAGLSLWWAPSVWSDTFGATFPAHQEVHCVSGEDWVYSWYATPTTHQVSGWWSQGCADHDACCRSFLGPLGCATVCSGLIPEVLETDAYGHTATWTYSDYSWTITSENAGYSGCTCPGHSPFEDDYECVE